MRGLIILLLILPVVFISCKTTKPFTTSNGSETRVKHGTTSKRAVVSNKQTTVSHPVYKKLSDRPVLPSGSPEEEYINRYCEIAVSEMTRTGVPASITLAQGMLESDYGRSRLAREGFNHFGIKCHGWDGGSIYHNDDKKNDCFRKYGNARESFFDHSEFIRTGSRYGFLFSLPHDDYKGWARGLQKAGYATNPDYANLLIRKIEEYNLDVFDRGYKAGNLKKIKTDEDSISEKNISGKSKVMVASNNEAVVLRPTRIMETNRVKYIIVKDGDTRESLENEFQLLKWELPRYNELPDDFRPLPGQILYLQPKRSKAEPGKEFYTTTDGDNMYLISQKFGIKLSSICEMNRMNDSIEPQPGTKIWLRTRKP